MISLVKKFQLVLLAVVCLLVTSFGLCSPNNALAQSTKYSAWIAYWDMETGEQELEQIRGKLVSLSSFAAYFDEQDKLFLPSQILEQKTSNKQAKYKTFLTFVNDKKLDEEKILSKDIEVLQRIFASDASMQAHIDEIIKVAQQYGYDGIEIDYERIWSDEQVGEQFNIFINKLTYQTIKNKLDLRVVLEPGIPFEKTDFARGPQYVVMLYNLYGLHSGPGPKADKAFIEKTIEKMSVLPEYRAVAFSTGGCVWGEDGSKRFITQQEAEQLKKTYKPEKVQRDDDSAALHFEYENFGQKYTVWYADVRTLNEWAKTSRQMGITDAFIWRLGGNSKLNLLK